MADQARLGRGAFLFSASLPEIRKRATAAAALGLGGAYLLLCLTFPGGGPLLEWFDGTRQSAADYVFIGYAAAAILLAAVIPAICWWEMQKWWTRSRYVAEQLRQQPHLVASGSACSGISSSNFVDL